MPARIPDTTENSCHSSPWDDGLVETSDLILRPHPSFEGHHANPC